MTARGSDLRQLAGELVRTADELHRRYPTEQLGVMGRAALALIEADAELTDLAPPADGPSCAVCHAPIEAKATGRPARYCSPRCRARARNRA